MSGSKMTTNIYVSDPLPYKHKYKEPKKETIICKKCNKSFKTMSGLRKHIFIHDENKLNKCDKCEKTVVHLKRLMVLHKSRGH